MGTLVPGLPSLFKDFLRTYWQTSSSLERLSSFKILLAFWGCNCWDTVVPVRLGISFSPLFTMIKLRTQIGLHHTIQTCASSLQLSVVHSKNAAHSLISRCALPWGSRYLASWENLAFRSSHWLGTHSPSTLHQSIGSNFCRPRASHRKHESGIHHSLCWVSQCVSDAAEWEGNIQLPPDTADHLGGSRKKGLSLYALFSF